MQNNESVIEMADNVIKSDGAKCVAAAIEYCPKLIEVRLSNCGIGDSGAESLFDQIGKSASVQVVDLSNNPITEMSIDTLDMLLAHN